MIVNLFCILQVVVIQHPGQLIELIERNNLTPHSGAGTWEHLLQYVSHKVGVDMDARKLETLPLGDIILSIVQEWMRKEKVSVKRFCIVSSKLGNLRIEEIMKEVEAKFENR